ncbi:STAS domain-containing protein [uncultured Tateyamaria sp.]
MSDALLLPERLDAVTAPALVSQLLTNSSGAIRLDARRTSHVDMFGAQVLLSARCTAQARNSAFCILHVQDCVQDQLTSIGLAHLTQPEEDT